MADSHAPPALAFDDADQAMAQGPEANAPCMVDALRLLARDAIAAAGSGDATGNTAGDTALALRMAEPVALLWTRFLKFDAADPRWPDRDRFVLSAGHGAALLHALLHLTGHAGMTLDDLRGFRRQHSPATGHPEHGAHPAVEATTGPPGQGLGNAVGMALAERLLAARFGRSLVDHRTWVVCDAADLADGLSQEAAAMAGQLRLEKLTLLFDDTEADDDLLKRFTALGWAARQVDGRDPRQMLTALAMAQRSRRPSLIACHLPRAPAPGDGWPRTPFHVPEQAAAFWRGAGMRGAGPRRAWLKRLTRHPLRPDFERMAAGRLPDGLHEHIAALKPRLAEPPAHSTEQASQLTRGTLAAQMPELIGGSAMDGAGAQDETLVTAECFTGRQLRWGGRSHAMATAMNGMALHGGILPHGDATLMATDSMRPALRLAALSRLRVIYVAHHDSIALGADGPAWQPMEQLASLRALPHLFVFRPADAMETVECWDLALRRADGPSLLALSATEAPGLRGDRPRAEMGENRCARGGYVVAPPEAPSEAHAPTATLIATGCEVAAAMAARALLALEGIFVSVVSLPCWELFAQQAESYRAAVLGAGPRFGIEAASGFGWERWLGPEGVFIGMAEFGASAPAADLYRRFALTPEAIALCVKRKLA